MLAFIPCGTPFSLRLLYMEPGYMYSATLPCSCRCSPSKRAIDCPGGQRIGLARGLGQLPQPQVRRASASDCVRAPPGGMVASCKTCEIYINVAWRHEIEMSMAVRGIITCLGLRSHTPDLILG